MGRGLKTENIHYNYELVVDGNRKYFRTAKCIAKHLELSHATIRNKINKPDMFFRKYKGVNIEIIKVHIPIFDIRVEQTKIEY
tara:strand:+ start:105 stop:353 length:249 start_codon:yes stop_codon:yes gene_type:complete